jgi:hypothetical protein
LGAGPIDIRFIFKNDGYHREAEARKGAYFDAAGDGGHSLLDGKGYQALNLLGSQRGGHGVHHDLVAGDIG